VRLAYRLLRRPQAMAAIPPAVAMATDSAAMVQVAVQEVAELVSAEMESLACSAR